MVRGLGSQHCRAVAHRESPFRTGRLMNTRSTIVRNTLFSSVGIYTEYFLGMLTSIIIARHLGPADLGTYSLVIWLVAPGVVITHAAVPSAGNRVVAGLQQGKGTGRG